MSGILSALAAHAIARLVGFLPGSGLAILKLSHCSAASSGCCALVRALRNGRNASLTSLDLSFNAITDAGALELASLFDPPAEGHGDGCHDHSGGGGGGGGGGDHNDDHDGGGSGVRKLGKAGGKGIGGKAGPYVARSLALLAVGGNAFGARGVARLLEAAGGSGQQRVVDRAGCQLLRLVGADTCSAAGPTARLLASTERALRRRRLAATKGARVASAAREMCAPCVNPSDGFCHFMPVLAFPAPRPPPFGPEGDPPPLLPSSGSGSSGDEDGGGGGGGGGAAGRLRAAHAAAQKRAYAAAAADRSHLVVTATLRRSDGGPFLWQVTRHGRRAAAGAAAAGNGGKGVAATERVRTVVAAGGSGDALCWDPKARALRLSLLLPSACLAEPGADGADGASAAEPASLSLDLCACGTDGRPLSKRLAALLSGGGGGGGAQLCASDFAARWALHEAFGADAAATASLSSVSSFPFSSAGPGGGWLVGGGSALYRDRCGGERFDPTGRRWGGPGPSVGLRTVTGVTAHSSCMGVGQGRDDDDAADDDDDFDDDLVGGGGGGLGGWGGDHVRRQGGVAAVAAEDDRRVLVGLLLGSFAPILSAHRRAGLEATGLGKNSSNGDSRGGANSGGGSTGGADDDDDNERGGRFASDAEAALRSSLGGLVCLRRFLVPEGAAASGPPVLDLDLRVLPRTEAANRGEVACVEVVALRSGKACDRSLLARRRVDLTAPPSPPFVPPKAAAAAAAATSGGGNRGSGGRRGESAAVALAGTVARASAAPCQAGQLWSWVGVRAQGSRDGVDDATDDAAGAVAGEAAGAENALAPGDTVSVWAWPRRFHYDLGEALSSVGRPLTRSDVVVEARRVRLGRGGCAGPTRAVADLTAAEVAGGFAPWGAERGADDEGALVRAAAAGRDACCLLDLASPFPMHFALTGADWL